MAEKTEQLQQQNLIQCESRRRLDAAVFSDNKLISVQIPRDSVYKRCHIYLEGSLQVTYAAGSPVASPYAISKLLPRLDVIINGQRTVKSIDPHLAEMLNSMYAGSRPRRAYRLEGVAVDSILGTTETPNGATFVYPATTEYVVWNEEFVLWFELPPWALAYEMGRSATLLNCKNVSSADLRFNFGAASSVQADGGAVAATYVADLSFIPTMIEARAVPSDQNFLDFKETISRSTFTGEVRDSLIQLPRGNALMGIGLLVRDGDSARTLRDRAIRDVQLLVNGQSVIQRTTFHELQNSLKSRYGCDDDEQSGEHTLRGFAYMNLLQSGDIRTALNTTIGAGVDTVNLAITTAPSSGIDPATYTNGVEVSLHAQELVSVPVAI